VVRCGFLGDGRRRLWIVPLALAISAVLATVVPAWPATFTVNSTADAPDAAPGDGVCETAPGNGICTLRAAIQEANALPGADVIVLPAGTYTLGLPDASGPSDLSGDLNIRGDLTIVGAGAGTTIVQACTVDQKTAPCPAGQGVADRVIGLPDVLPRVTVELRGMTIRNGRHTSSGGGIENLGHTLVLRDSVVADNNQSDDGPSGIGGGGIYSSGPVSLFDSAVRNNTAGPGGGGIAIVGPPANALVLVRSTVSGNTARGSSAGGGISTAGALTVINSTVSGNTAGICGGIDFFGITGLMNNSTITGNTASRSFGGGVCNSSLFLTSFTVANTIIAGNTDVAAAIPDCSGRFTSRGFNLIGNGAGCGTGFMPFFPSFVDGVNGDQVGTGGLVIDPRLGPLADNGGPTLTHALLPGSPALGTGSPEQPGSGGNACESTDQRGVPRPQPAGGRCDVGAVEGTGSGSLALGRIRPTRAGNVAPVMALVYGANIRDGAGVRLTRAGQPDIVGDPVAVAAEGVIATTFDLTGQAPGAWDVTVVNPDGTSATLSGAFTVEAGGGPRLWSDVVGPTRIARNRQARYFVLFGNRGNVDAFAVPVGLTLPRDFRPSLRFPIAPPPAQAGQVPTDWSATPITVDTGPSSDYVSVPLLLPVVPAGFSGVLEFTLTATRTGPFQITSGIGAPYFQPGLNSRVTAASLRAAAAYAARTMGITAFPLNGATEQYAVGQLESVVALGVTSLVDTQGRRSQVYSLPQLIIDLARFGAVQAE
jgi:CSLREA domain-containing protein